MFFKLLTEGRSLFQETKVLVKEKFVKNNVFLFFLIFTLFVILKQNAFAEPVNSYFADLSTAQQWTYRGQSWGSRCLAISEAEELLSEVEVFYIKNETVTPDDEGVEIIRQTANEWVDHLRIVYNCSGKNERELVAKAMRDMAYIRLRTQIRYVR